MKIDIQINKRDSKRILDSLAKLQPKLSRKILREESRKTAKSVLLPVAKQNTPKDTGLMRKSIKIVSIKRSRVAVGVRLAMSSKKFPGDRLFYGGFLEYGIPATNKKTGKQQRARPAVAMLKRTADTHGQQAVDRFSKAVLVRLGEAF